MTVAAWIANKHIIDTEDGDGSSSSNNNSTVEVSGGESEQKEFEIKAINETFRGV